MRYFLFLISVFMTFGLQAQYNKQPVTDTETLKKVAPQDDLYLPPLDTLLVWAEVNNATIKMQEALIEKAEADTRRVKKSWMDGITFSANISNGQFGNSVINQTQIGYRYGPAVALSLYEITSNRDLTNVYRAEEKVATFKRDEVAFELRKLITILYNNVLAQKNILRIKSDGLNAAYMHQKMAEKEFNQGAIALGELARVTEIYTKAQTEIEITINDLKNYYMQLEQFCGRKFSKP